MAFEDKQWPLKPRVRMGPPPRSFAADAHACIMVQVPRGSTEYKVAARWRRPIASSPQIVTPSPGKGNEIDVELDTASPIQGCTPPKEAQQGRVSSPGLTR